jgi:hypothetical protein
MKFSSTRGWGRRPLWRGAVAKLRTESDGKFDLHGSTSESIMSILQRMEEIETEMARTQKNVCEYGCRLLDRALLRDCGRGLEIFLRSPFPKLENLAAALAIVHLRPP